MSTPKPNLAQRLLLSIGANNIFGPAPSVLQQPAPQWLGQHTNPQRNETRKANRSLGRRQARKLGRYLNATQGS